jgi:hypothetical protein
MSSQTLATASLGGGGLPKTPPPAPNLEPSWSTDHMAVTEPQRNHDSTSLPPDQSVHQRSVSSSSANNTQQHRQALNNLLAALNPSNASGSTPAQTAPGAEPATQADSVPFTNNPDIQHHDNKQQNPAATANPSTPPPIPNAADMESFLAQSTFMDLPPLPPLNNISPPMADTQLPIPPPLQIPDGNMANPLTPPRNYRREIEAFAKLEFVDGEFYITTWQVELGRDLLAYRDAVERERQEKENPQGRSQSSSGRMSRPSDRIRREPDSQVQGSVVSEIGGFGGIDEAPVQSHEENVNENGQQSHSSQVSASDIVKPGDIFPGARAAGFITDFDYNLRGKQVEAFEAGADEETPAPVTADHLPNANICPLVPIHANVDSVKSEVELHKGISRRHVRIEWNADNAYFQLRVLGRNGAFVDDKFLRKGQLKELKNGSKIQLSGVTANFKLPRQPTPSAPTESVPSEFGQSPEPPEVSPVPQESESATPAPKINLKLNVPKAKTTSTPAAVTEPLIGPDGQPIVRKRGPGRPPKDGIMSTRERKEREKAAKLAEAKAANGGKTPPPMSRGKFTKPPTKEEIARAEAKFDKRKYTKRKRDEDGEIMQSIEGGEENVPSDVEKVPVKKPKQSKSPSPEYPSLATLTEENLARPSDPYARLIYDILIEIYPKALPLKQIYRALKLKYPFFVYRVESDGWQSSVRHNLNQEWNKLFEKGEKEGKGFAWKAIPGALQPQAERKRAAQAAAAAKPKPQPPRQPPQQGQQGNWQNQGGYPYWQGQNGFQPPPNGVPWSQNGAPPGQAAPTPNGQSFLPAGQQAVNAARGSVNPPYPAQGQNGQPNSVAPLGATPVKPPLGPPASSSSAPHNMPCTLDGYLAIRRFESSMYDLITKNKNPNMDQWKQVFNSAYSRILHGSPASTVPGGETKEEVVIMAHMKAFVEQHRNPQFKGFASQAKATASANTSTNSTNTPAAVQPVNTPHQVPHGQKLPSFGTPGPPQQRPNATPGAPQSQHLGGNHGPHHGSNMAALNPRPNGTPNFQGTHPPPRISPDTQSPSLVQTTPAQQNLGQTASPHPPPKAATPNGTSVPHPAAHLPPNGSILAGGPQQQQTSGDVTMTDAPPAGMPNGDLGSG